MNCRRVEQLIALHAGGDLAGGDERAVAQHLEECAGCRRLADGFAQSRSLLAAHEPPEFDEAFFDSVRRNVMREIDDAPKPWPLAPFFSRLLAPRALAYAASLALLVAAGALAYRTLNGRGGEGVNTQEVVSRAGVETAATPAPAAPGSTPLEATAPRVTPVPKAAPPAVAAKSQRRPLPAPSRGEQAAREGAPKTAPALVVSGSSEMARLSNDPSLNAAAGELAAHEGAPAEGPDRKMLRIELRTGDPNVRIIWLTPQAEGRPAKD